MGISPHTTPSPKLVTKPRILNYNIPVFKPLTAIVITQENPWTAKSGKSSSEPKPDYIIVSGDTLTSVSEAQKVPLDRLWAANTQLTDPNLLTISDPLKIPLDTDKLDARPYPDTINNGLSIGSSPHVATSTGGFSSSGNFVFGWCTFYADQQRPDIHATGNAADWIRYSNSSVPVVGAVAVNTFAAGGLGHVGIVVDFNATQVLVRSMNFHKFGDVTTDWVDRGYWAGYIL